MYRFVMNKKDEDSRIHSSYSSEKALVLCGSTKVLLAAQQVPNALTVAQKRMRNIKQYLAAPLYLQKTMVGKEMGHIVPTGMNNVC
jgi:hypothetical protein